MGALKICIETEIYLHLEKHPGLRVEEVAEDLKLTPEDAEFALNELRAIGKAVEIYADSNRGYEWSVL